MTQMGQAAWLSGGRELQTDGTAGAKEGRVLACSRRSRKADVAAASKWGERWKSLEANWRVGRSLVTLGL